VPIEPMVLVEARVLRSDYSVLEIGRDLAERNEFVVFVIWRVVNPSLQAALGVHRGCRWVDPPGAHKDQRGKRPNKYHGDDKTSNKGAERTLSKWGLGTYVWPWSHISEYQPGLEGKASFFCGAEPVCIGQYCFHVFPFMIVGIDCLKL